MGVADDFSRFKDAYNMSAATIGNISYRYKRITAQLNTDFWATTSDTAHSLYVGSYGRDTAAAGLSDLDVAFMLPHACYVKYSSYAGNGQSALLQAVKRSVQNTYPNSEVSGDGQVVVVGFSDGTRFEILAVFQNTVGSSWTYPNANAGGGGAGGAPNGAAGAPGAFAASDKPHELQNLSVGLFWEPHCGQMIIDGFHLTARGGARAAGYRSRRARV